MVVPLQAMGGYLKKLTNIKCLIKLMHYMAFSPGRGPILERKEAIMYKLTGYF